MPAARERFENVGPFSAAPLVIRGARVRVGVASWTDPTFTAKGVFYPGEVEYLREQRRRKDGIEIEDATWEKLRTLAGEYKIADKLGFA